jgi:hypothetical protein
MECSMITMAKNDMLLLKRITLTIKNYNESSFFLFVGKNRESKASLIL